MSFGEATLAVVAFVIIMLTIYIFVNRILKTIETRNTLKWFVKSLEYTGKGAESIKALNTFMKETIGKTAKPANKNREESRNE